MKPVFEQKKGDVHTGSRYFKISSVLVCLAMASLLSDCRENQSPEAFFTATPEVGEVPLQVLFDASSSIDADGTIVSFNWDWGDSEVDTGITVSHTYTNPGTYVAELTVVDDEGAEAKGGKTITVYSPFEHGTVPPEGAILEFANDVTLTFPAGAVTETTEIMLRELMPSDLSTFLRTPIVSFDNVRILGGFVAESDVREFDVPVEVSLPVRELTDPTGVPVHVLIDVEHGAHDVDETNLEYDPAENRVDLQISTFSPHAVMIIPREIPPELLLETPEQKAARIAFFLGVDAAYRSGNTGPEGFLDFTGGFQKAANYLDAQIGSRYDEEHVFCGFDLTIVSEVTETEPQELPPVYRNSTVSLGQRSGEGVEKLYEDQPWVNATYQDRAYVNTLVQPPTTTQETYDISVVAYTKPHSIQFSVMEVSLDLDIHFCRYIQELWTCTDRSFGEKPIDAPTGTLIPMPASFSREIRGSFEAGVGDVKMAFREIDDGWGYSFTSSSFAEKEDGRSWYIDSWRADPLTGVNSNVTVWFQMRVDNPEMREITVKFEHEGHCSGPADLGGPWVQQSLSFLQVPPGSSPPVPSPNDIQEVYGAYGESSHSGVKEFRFNDEVVILGFDFEPHQIRAVDFLENQLKYSIDCSSTVTVRVLGLY